MFGRSRLIPAITAAAIVANGERVRARSQADWDCTTAPRTFRATDVIVRPPRIRDAAAWGTARLANRARLESAFPADAGNWAAEQGETAWLERCLRLTIAARRGLAYPAIMVDVTSGHAPAVLGEIGIDAVDPRTRTGEVSAWASAAMPSGRVVRWALARVLLTAFTAREPLLRVVAPFATANPAPEATLRALGFECEHTLTRHRTFAGAPADHRIFVLHNTPETRAVLSERCA